DSAESDRRELRARLAAWLARDDVREALALSAPGLLDNVPLWEADPASKKGRGVERALIRYLARLCSRTTPFGLAAGYSVGTLADRCDLTLAGVRECRRKARLDMGILADLAARVLDKPEYRRRL